MSDRQTDPIELIVIKNNERMLIDLMATTIEDVKFQLYSKGLVGRTNIGEQYEVLTRKGRMWNVLEFIHTMMEKESEELAKKTFDKFLEGLREDRSWDSLRNRLSKCVEEERKKSTEVSQADREKSKLSKPTAKVFRETLSEMVDILHYSVTDLVYIWEARGIYFDEATREQAIKPRQDSNITKQIMEIVKTKVRVDPGNNFREFIKALEDVDGGFFRKTINDLERDLKLERQKRDQEEKAMLEKQKQEHSQTAGEDESIAKGADLMTRLEDVSKED